MNSNCSSKSICVSYIPKAKPTPADQSTMVRRYRSTVSVKPDFDAKVVIHSEFEDPFILMTLVSEEPSAHYIIGDVCGTTVTVTVRADAICVAKLFIELRDHAVLDESQ